MTTIVVVAPAQWLAFEIRKASGGQVELADATGSVWSGRAIVVIGSGELGTAPVSLAGPLSWKLSAWPLLAGVIDLTLSHPTVLAQPLTVRATFRQHVDLGADTLRLPASLLAALGAPWNTIRPGGIIMLSWDRLSIEPGHIVGNLSAEWQFASSGLTAVSPFGHYRLQTNGIYPGTQLQLTTLSGPLELSGNGTIGEGARVRFQGVARVVPGADPAVKVQLAGLIALLGRREGDTAILSFGN
ncbi:MAG: type II secretion system protein N [Gemmatimonadota bacterium]